jgi:acyl-coenzyme A thioesterase PaaI-like protein
MLVDVASCRAVESAPVLPSGGIGVAAADTVLHYLRPARVGPIEARCRVLGGPPGRTLVRVAVHDIGADHRLVALGAVSVLEV